MHDVLIFIVAIVVLCCLGGAAFVWLCVRFGLID